MMKAMWRGLQAFRLQREGGVRGCMRSNFCSQPSSSEGGGEVKSKVGRIFMNLVNANWRGQLTTLTPKRIASSKEKAADRLTATFVNYIFHDGKIVIFLPSDSPHCANLLIDSRASFLVGHTDPASLIKTFQSVGKVPPHGVVVGCLELLKDDQVTNGNNFRMVLNEKINAMEQVADGASSAFGSIIEDSHHLLEKHVNALSTMMENKEEDAFFQFDVRSVQFVDSMGTKHSVEWNAIFQSVLDPISPFLSVIVDGINLKSSRRVILRMFSLCYLRVKVMDAYILSADRWGIDILANVQHVNAEADKYDKTSNEMKWKELRLSFPKSVNDVEEFFSMMLRMERECVTTFDKLQSRLRSIQTG